MFKTFNYKRLFQYFLQGLLVLAPIVVTGYALFWIVTSIDELIPIFTFTDDEGKVIVRNFGLGFVIIIGAICLVGYLSTFFIQSRIFNLFDHWLEKVPGIKFIYTTVKDFFEAFAGEKKKFNRPVLANIDDNDVWRVGFLTREDTEDFGLKDYVAVYVPMSYSIAGNVYLIPSNRIRSLEGHLTGTEAMKFAISGGVTKMDEEIEEEISKEDKALKQ
ncbi:DUF502 domain-containing protein [Lacibacter sp.]|jgi:uncharacterized membrane protein|uniref:DUF502 domain-containing protein n=1 Tax=Lacibacter sp. TaxID=1915409 RepID=UPI002B4B6B2B|nr:DUF502 domain-containing protein [Lacibacter sp.]HLP39603.1 DUF502 domain-containing protein [Lacibacter sp.]